jgi:hypothetical protein
MSRIQVEGLFWCEGCNRLFRSDAIERVYGMVSGGGGFFSVDASILKCPLCSREISPIDLLSAKSKATAMAQKGMDARSPARPWWKFW